MRRSPDDRVLILRLRPARRRARDVARAEALALLGDLGARLLEGGPLSEQPALFWIAIPEPSIDAARPRLTRLGYCDAVELLDLAAGDSGAIRWKGGRYRLRTLYREDPGAAREEAPDRRRFLFESADGEVREVRGYRGDGEPLSRRGLPAYDARMLVNLAAVRPGMTALEPFAGVGGIVLALREAGARVLSIDVDPSLRHGLAAIAWKHLVARAEQLPLGEETVDAVAAEPPFHPDAWPAVTASLPLIARSLHPGARFSVLCERAQSIVLRDAARSAGLILDLDSPVDRKGLPVQVMVWRKSGPSETAIRGYPLATGDVPGAGG